MASPRVKVDVIVDDAATEALIRRVEARLTGNNLEVFLRGPAHEYFSQEIAWDFEGGGKGAGGGKWEGLHDATQDIRQALGYNPTSPVNVRTGEMERVLTEEADFFSGMDEATMILPGSAGGANRAISEKIKTAQEGKPSGNALGLGPTLPRPVLGISAWNAEQVLTALNVWMMNDIAGHF